MLDPRTFFMYEKCLRKSNNIRELLKDSYIVTIIKNSIFYFSRSIFLISLFNVILENAFIMFFSSTASLRCSAPLHPPNFMIFLFQNRR